MCNRVLASGLQEWKCSFDLQSNRVRPPPPYTQPDCDIKVYLPFYEIYIMVLHNKIIILLTIWYTNYGLLSQKVGKMQLVELSGEISVVIPIPAKYPEVQHPHEWQLCYRCDDIHQLHECRTRLERIACTIIYHYYPRIPSGSPHLHSSHVMYNDIITTCIIIYNSAIIDLH